VRALVAACLLLLAAPARGLDRVLLVTVDTLRADALGCYGSQRVATPHVDSLAARGVRFEEVVAPAPLTLPSHASLLTALDPPGHGLRDNSGFVLPPAANTLAEVLASKGWDNGAFVAALPLDSRFGLDQGFAVYDDAFEQADAGPADTATPQRSGRAVTDAALAWLRERGGRPWFAWVHYFDPHFPYQPPPHLRERYAATPYAGEVAAVDEQVGRLLAFLEQSGQKERTLVVLTADHGESLGEHRELSHGIFAYESTLRIPLLFAPFPPRTVRGRVRLVDVAPTILDLLGLGFPTDVDGRSLRARLAGAPAPAEPPPAYFEALAMYLNLGWAPLRGYYSGRHKYVDLPEPELYDLAADPAEARNLCAAGAEPCRTWAQRFLAHAGPFRPPAPSEPVDAETRAQLAALGYVAGGAPPPRQAGRQPGVEADPKRLIRFHNEVNRALHLQATGRTDAALGLLQGVMRARPADGVAYTKAAAILAEAGRAAEAAGVLEAALRNGADTVFVRRDLGLLLVRLGRGEEGIRHLRTAVRAEPNRLDLAVAAGEAYLAVGQVETAERAYRHAVTLDGSAVEARLGLGTVLILRERWQEAAEQFRTALAVRPGLARAHTGLGLAQAALGKPGEASASWERALALDPGDLEALWRLANARWQTGARTNAVPLLERFVAQAPPERYRDELAAARAMLAQARG
jgi:arylsulfatase A-like enzyme/Tfp pilus assembly protein PilF